MLHHVEIYVSDIARTRRFWVPLLAHASYSEAGFWDDGFTLETTQKPYLTFVQVEERHAKRPYHRCATGLNHLAFTLPDRASVDALRQYCKEQNITCLYDDRYPFANGGTDYYALFIEDPDRIKFEFVAQD
ncbi:MAG: VOC family protein [Pseudomonadota bacterium]